MPTSELPHGVEASPELSPLLERVAELAGDDERASLVVRLAWATFRRAPAERLAAADLTATARMLLDAFRFIDAREPGTLALRVFDPDAQEHGWTSPGTVIDANLDDGPFLLTTITEELGRLGLEVAEVVHPVVGVLRDPDGRVTALLPARQSDTRESWIHLRLTDRLSAERQEQLAGCLRAVLDDARAATRDFPAMKAQVEEVAFQTRASAGTRYRPDEVDETIALLNWLLDDHFVMLGYREYDITEHDGEPCVTVRRGSGLGILADESSSRWAAPVPLSQVEQPLRRRVEAGELLVVSRTNRVSTVHRQTRMIYIGVKKVGGDGRLLGECRFLGLFAQKAFAEPASTIPVLRRKLRQILEREDVVDHSHDERSLRALFEALPKHELFAADVATLRTTLVELLEAQRSSDVRLLLRRAQGNRSVSVLVAVPRERFNAEIRKRVQDLLVQRFGAAGVDYQLTMTERDRALLHFVLHAGRGQLAEVPAEELERDVNALTRSWADDLLVELVRVHGEEEGQRLARRWAARFPAGYAETTSVSTACEDIAHLQRVCLDPDSGDVAMAMRPDPDAAGLLRFTLYKVGAGVELSSFLPILESLGLTVVEEIPYRLEVALGAETGDADAAPLHIHNFGVRAAGTNVDVANDGPRLAAAAMAVWDRRAEGDSLNRLVLRAGLEWEDVAVLRTYRRYRRQVGTTFTESYLDDALVEHPDVARALVALFVAKFHPNRAGDLDEARAQVLSACDAVERLDTDRILRDYLGMVEATLRTNRYAGRSPDGPGPPHLALKFDSAAVPAMPRPVPYREVFVCSPHMEGVHLRGGPVARGGLRWSDRREDFRTEVLGLMKAQVVKNAVIVPTGSKGGFVVKRPPADPGELRAEVRRQYETFVRGLLDVTDNVVDGRVVGPPRVRRHDGDDPYLVVAADRGTATFSDVANGISAHYGFWLGDAFASGGSRGYDHKAMGITARGAWVAVQRHFRELDVDVQTEPVTVVGIGDMSGDVFGNGLLRSEAVKLVAAFDHRDILLDPDPDPVASFAERRRLFQLPRSSWQDYDRAVLSEGGGVWSRSAKRVPLSRPVQRLLRTDVEALTPPELVQALLRAPVDLLFAGGIGTFVKSSEETHADVGDRANDAVRIDATEVGARVVAEGGNLAFTQRARIQYARRGGRINTDAIDNAAGVDTSDHEVNLKILLDIAVHDALIDRDDRDALLARMGDEVAGQVLRSVYLQTGAISQELAQSPGVMEAYEALMEDLEEGVGEPGGQGPAGRLERDVEVLPDAREMARRAAAGAGLTRPELAVLLAYAKIDLATRLLGSPVPDHPAFTDVLAAYFPHTAAERFGERLGEHRLRRELVATCLANDLVNRMGITYANRTAHELGCTSIEVVPAYWTARGVCDAEARWRAIEALDGRADPTLQLQLKSEVDRVVDAFIRSYLRHPADDLSRVLSQDREAFQELEKALSRGGPLERYGEPRSRVQRYTDLGIEPDLAESLVTLGSLTLVPDVAAVARAAGQPVRHVAEVFFRLTDGLPLDRLGLRLRELTPRGHWERWQHQGLLDDLRELRRDAAARAIEANPDVEAVEAVQRFLSRRVAGQERVATVVALLGREREDGGLPAVAVAVRALREALK